MCLISAPVWAHDLWLEKETGGWTLFQGHRHSGHAGADVVPYEPASVKAVACASGDGAYRAAEVRSSYPVRVPGTCSSVLVTFSTGYWTKTPWETRNAPKPGVPGAIKSWFSEETLKLVDAWSAGSARPAGSGLEITPVSNPLQLHTGDKLVVLVTDGGRPVAGVPVAYAGDTRGATDADGRIAIRLRAAGVQLIQASQEVPATDGKADTVIRSASLQFMVAK